MSILTNPYRKGLVPARRQCRNTLRLYPVLLAKGSFSYERMILFKLAHSMGFLQKPLYKKLRNSKKETFSFVDSAILFGYERNILALVTKRELFALQKEGLFLNGNYPHDIFYRMKMWFVVNHGHLPN